MSALALSFQNTQFDVIDQDNKPWLRSPQIAEALGYAQANRVTDLYNRNADEFTETMTALVELDTSGGKQQVRIFSLRGCHLLAMSQR
jgi:prophage antirepressor-like protein